MASTRGPPSTEKTLGQVRDALTAGDAHVQLDPSARTQHLTDLTTVGTIYEGWAPSGTATSAAAWDIKKTTISATSIVEKWSAANSIWDNRATTVTYS